MPTYLSLELGELVEGNRVAVLDPYFQGRKVGAPREGSQRVEKQQPDFHRKSSWLTFTSH